MSLCHERQHDQSIFGDSSCLFEMSHVLLLHWKLTGFHNTIASFVQSTWVDVQVSTMSLWQRQQITLLLIQCKWHASSRKIISQTFRCLSDWNWPRMPRSPSPIICTSRPNPEHGLDGQMRLFRRYGSIQCYINVWLSVPCVYLYCFLPSWLFSVLSFKWHLSC